MLNLNFEEWNKNSFNNYNEIINILSEDYSINTIVLTLLAIIRFLEYSKAGEKILKEYNEVLNDIIGERTKIEHSQNKSESEKINWINYEELKDNVEEKSEEYLNKKKSFTKYRNFLILSLFSLQPPRS